MPTGTHSESFQVGSVVFNRTVSKSADNANTYGDASSPITLAVGIATGATWVKDTGTTAHGTATGANAAGWGASAVVDVYDANGVLYAYGVTATMTTDAFALASGTKITDYPASATAMILCKQQQVNVNIDGDNASLVGIQSTVIGHADFQDSSSNSIRALSLAAVEADCWDADKAVNPYTGAVISKVLASNGTTTAGILQIAVLQDSTP